MRTRTHASWAALCAVLLAVALMAGACSTGSGEGGRSPGEGGAGSATAVETPGGSGGGSDSGSNGSSGDGSEESDAPAFERIPAIVREAQPSVVTVLTGKGLGSGVVYDSDGIIVTNEHVIENAEQIRVAFADGTQVPAELVASDLLTDLAVLRVDRGDLPAAEFETDIPPVGELAVAIGSPLGFSESVTAGIVSGINRDLPNEGSRGAALINLIQTDAAISPGNSGGALVDEQGKVIGINDAYIPPQAGAVSIGFAIPSKMVVRVVKELLKDGSVDHVLLGVRPQTITPRIAERFNLAVEHGAGVLQVIEGSAAEAAGLEPGDVIVKLDSTEINSVEDLLGQLAQLRPGDTVSLTYFRDGQEHTVQVTFTATRSTSG